MIKYILVSVFIFSSLLINAQECDIPNGNFESWNGDKPTNWGTTNVAHEVNSPLMGGFDMRTVLKSSDANSGSYSLHLKNPSILDFLKSKPGWEQMSKMPMIKKQIEEMIKTNTLSASAYWCRGDCDSDLIAQNTSGFVDKISFPVDKTPRSICGYYKTNLKGGDKLWINPFLLDNAGGAGGPKVDDRQAVITENTSKWKKFKVPLYLQEGKKARAAGVQFYIVNSKFPNAPPYGMSGMRLGMSLPGTEGSEVWIDDVCFCDNISIDIWDPALFGGKQIESGIKLSEGAQTPENIDNDDNDEFWDYNPVSTISDSEVEKDDELVKIRLQIPFTNEEKEEITLEIIKGKENVRLWLKKNKGEQLKVEDKLFTNTSDFEKKEGFWEKEIWVEGIKSSNEQQGIVFKVYRKNEPETFDEVSLTILGIESIEWKGRGNSKNNDDNLDFDVNFRKSSDKVTISKDPCNCDNVSESTSSLKPGAVRVFPGKRIAGLNKTEKNIRNKVIAEVSFSVKPVRPIPVYFVSFDVDDPTILFSVIPEMDNERSKNDNIGFIEKDGKKIFTGWMEGQRKDGILKEEISKKTIKINFEVSMQPGDNFRIIGVFDEKFLKELNNDDFILNKKGEGTVRNQSKQRIVHQPTFEKLNKPEESEIRNIEKYASKVLTVWRFAYAEVDKMGSIGKDVLFSKIVSYELNNPKAGQTKIFIEDNIIKKLKDDGITEPTMGPTHTNVGMKDAFKEGDFRLAGQTFKILENSANKAGYIFNGAADYIVIDGLLPELDNYEGKVCGLKFDDENKWGFKAGDPMPDLNPDVCVLERIFRKSYLIIDFDTMNTISINPNQETRFIRNTNADDFAAIKSNYKFDNKNLANDDDFWCFYINTCYAGATAEDGDPDDTYISGSWENAITGIADDEKLGINIFMEGLLEFNKLSWTNKNKYLCTRSGVGSGKGDVIAHEIAHLFGAIHEIDLGIMNIKSNSFTEMTISRIRKAKHP